MFFIVCAGTPELHAETYHGTPVPTPASRPGYHAGETRSDPPIHSETVRHISHESLWPGGGSSGSPRFLERSMDAPFSPTPDGRGLHDIGLPARGQFSAVSGTRSWRGSGGLPRAPRAFARDHRRHLCVLDQASHPLPRQTPEVDERPADRGECSRLGRPSETADSGSFSMDFLIRVLTPGASLQARHCP